MASQPATCARCEKPLGRYNRSGRCRSCLIRSLASDPEFQRKRGDGIRRAMQANPERREAYAARARAIFHLPQAVEARRSGCIERRLWERGNAAQHAGSEARRKAGARSSATKLAWCPSHLRQAYRELTAKGIKSTQAQAAILEQHETEMRRWRKSVAPQDQERSEARRVAPLNPDAPLIDRAASVAAQHIGVPSIWNPSQTQPFVRARWAVFLALQRDGMSLSAIAEATGYERTTIRHGLLRAAVLAAGPNDFADLCRLVQAA